jgi:hypothetical protein
MRDPKTIRNEYRRDDPKRSQTAKATARARKTARADKRALREVGSR